MSERQNRLSTAQKAEISGLCGFHEKRCGNAGISANFRISELPHNINVAHKAYKGPKKR